MLKVILQTLLENINHTPQEAPQVTPQVNELLQALRNVGSISNRDALQQHLQLRDRKSFRERYLKPALENGFIEMTIPDKPSSKLQQYKLTAAGLAFIKG